MKIPEKDPTKNLRKTRVIFGATSRSWVTQRDRPTWRQQGAEPDFHASIPSYRKLGMVDPIALPALVFFFGAVCENIFGLLPEDVSF